MEVTEANNTTIDSDKSPKSASTQAHCDDEFLGYCALCKSITKIAREISYKFKWMVVVLMVFQVILETIYYISQRDFIIGEQKYV